MQLKTFLNLTIHKSLFPIIYLPATLAGAADSNPEGMQHMAEIHRSSAPTTIAFTGLGIFYRLQFACR